jgi:hypothetical protein
VQLYRIKVFQINAPKRGRKRDEDLAEGKTGGEETKKRVEAKQTRETGQVGIRDWITQ